MRPLTDDETKAVFEKLAKFIGGKLKYMVEREDKNYVFRLHRDRVFYLDEDLLKWALHFETKKLISAGTCIGKFTKGGNFRLHITSLLYLAKYAKNKVWIKPNGEQSFLYGNNVMKSHVLRLTEDTTKNSGVVIYNVNDVPIGFGVTAKSTLEIKDSEPTAIVVYNQAEIGILNLIYSRRIFKSRRGSLNRD